jgi:hypothetical protein
MATKSITMDKVGLKQIIAKAGQELVSYQAQQVQAEKQFDAAVAELDSLTTRAAGRNQALQLAGQTVQRLQSELEQTRLRASLAQGTLVDIGEVSTKDLEKRLERAQKELTQLQIRTGKEESADSDRRTIVQESRGKHQESIARCSQYQEALAEQRERALADLGEIEHQEVMTRLRDLQNDVDLKEQELHQVRADLDAFSAEAIQRLSDWPDPRPQLSYHDNTTAVMEATVAFLNVCLNQGHDAANIDTNIFRRAGLPWADLFRLLSFEQRDFYGVLRGDGFHARLDGPLTLEERRDQISKLLQVYRAEKISISQLRWGVPSRLI